MGFDYCKDDDSVIGMLWIVWFVVEKVLDWFEVLCFCWWVVGVGNEFFGIFVGIDYWVDDIVGICIEDFY